MGRQNARTILGFPVVALAALAVTACGSEIAARRAPPGTLMASRCPVGVPQEAQCHQLAVRENRERDDSRIISLRIIVLPARSAVKDPDPILLLAGGPGQAASGLIRYSGIPDSLRTRRDLVFVDQRGTGGSHVLRCQFYRALDVQSYFTPFMPVHKVRECRDRLRASADLTQYTTDRSVEDLEEVRAAFGYESVNLIGLSYGTRLAMEYVRAHEPRVRSVILEGVASPSLHVPENFGILAQQALDALLDACAAATECAAAFPSIRDHARAVFARVKEKPVAATIAHPGSGQSVEVLLTQAHVAEEIRYMTYASYEAARVPLVLEMAYRGDFSPLARSLIRRRGDGSFDGLYLSITCTEDVPFVPADADAREADTYLAGYRVREQQAACAEWPRGAAPEWIGRPVTANVPVLILSGALDPVTPPASGAEVATTLPHSLHVTIPHGGHSPAGLNGLECVQHLKAAFVERGSVVGLDTRCVERITRPRFAITAADLP